ncbi:hypothetical protein AB6A40_001304 [Gnathostoma spinigerum]|uniref:Uncharacterized protein n=1 Tax=Gnathostoma spinigerum TaxID=75299 RepID=A0ABD6EE48_9BILA
MGFSSNSAKFFSISVSVGVRNRSNAAFFCCERSVVDLLFPSLVASESVRFRNEKRWRHSLDSTGRRSVALLTTLASASLLSIFWANSNRIHSKKNWPVSHCQPP